MGILQIGILFSDLCYTQMALLSPKTSRIQDDITNDDILLTKFSLHYIYVYLYI